MTLELDNTKRRSYSLCPRKFYYEHVLNLRPKTFSTALRFGLTWHSILEAYYKEIKENGWKNKEKALSLGICSGKETWEKESEGKSFYSDYRTLENCLAAFISYIDYYKDDEFFLSVIDVESPFKLQLSPEVYFVGKIDGIVTLNDNLWLLEHKTTGMAIDKQLKTLTRDPQIIGYTFAGMQLFQIEGVLVSMTSLSSTKSKVTGEYGKARIEHRRSPQIFIKDDMETWKDSFLWTASQIISSKENNYWPCQLDSCYHFGNCTYTSLCEQNPKDLSLLNTSNFIEVPHWNVLEGNL